MKTRRMLTIAWDVDDVLNDFMRVWFETHWASEHPKCLLDYRDLQQNPPAELLGISIDQYQISLDRFRLSDGFKNMFPAKEVQQWFIEHGHRFRHVAVTAAPLKTVSASAEWVMRHFGMWIRTFHAVPSPRKTDGSVEYDRTKADFLEWLGKVDIFVDDSEENVSAGTQAVASSILFPRPWNRATATIAETLNTILDFAHR